MKKPFYEYVDNVLDGKIITGKFIRLAVERFIKDCDKKDYIFDYKEGERVVNFAEKFCHHWKGPKRGKPIILEPHQHFYWIQKYGWRNPNAADPDGKLLPRFRRSAKMIARKQYKTTEAAVESLFHMAKGIDQPAQVFTCATKEDDAVVVVNDAGRIAMASPKLKGKFRCMIHEPYVRRVIYGESFMTYMTKGHDAVDISMGIGDECHDWPDASIKNRIESAMGNRLAPTFSTITTAGFDKSGYCFDTLRDTSIKILNQQLEDEEQLILIFEMDEEDDWKDSELWVKPNPNLHHSLSHKPYLESEFKKAVNEGGTTEVNFKTKNLNMWVDAPVVWIQSEVWQKNRHGINPETLKGKLCYGGLDLARTVDLNAFVLWFPNADGEISAALPFFWIPESKVENHKDRVDYQKWIDKGLMFKTAGNVADYKQIATDIKRIISEYNFKSLAYDRYLTGHGVLADLLDEGIECHELGQNIVTLNMPTKELERIVTSGKLEHFGNPVLAWMMGNTLLTKDTSGNVKPDKGKSEKKIDGVSAMINALAEFKTFEGQEIDLTFTAIK